MLEKYVEGVRQEEKDVPHLLESIMRPTDPVKEELRSILLKLIQGSLKYNSGHARAKVQNNKDSANIKKYCPSQT